MFGRIRRFLKLAPLHIRISVQISYKQLHSLRLIENKRNENIPFKINQNLRIHVEGGSSVNFDEIKHHEKLAPQWWKVNGPLRALHSMNMIRVPFIRDGLIATNKTNSKYHHSDKVLKDLNLLEVGCGGGILTEQLARLHSNIIGIDLGSELIKIAIEHLKMASPELINRVQYKVESIEEHSKLNKAKYDAVVVSEVLEHIGDKGKFLTACVDALKPGGSIFITTFNKSILSLIGGILFAEYILCIVPKRTHNWNKFITPIETRRILESLNCSAVLVNGFTYEFWNNTWKWIPITEFSYALQAIKCE